MGSTPFCYYLTCFKFRFVRCPLFVLRYGFIIHTSIQFAFTVCRAIIKNQNCVELKAGVSYMALVYKFNVLASLKDAGYSTYRLRNEKILGESPIQHLREGVIVTWENLDTICRCLNCQPGDILEYIPDSLNIWRKPPMVCHLAVFFCRCELLVHSLH